MRSRFTARRTPRNLELPRIGLAWPGLACFAWLSLACLWPWLVLASSNNTPASRAWRRFAPSLLFLLARRRQGQRQARLSQAKQAKPGHAKPIFGRQLGIVFWVHYLVAGPQGVCPGSWHPSATFLKDLATHMLTPKFGFGGLWGRSGPTKVQKILIGPEWPLVAPFEL